ncbi:MAG: hypothetical protein ACOY90_17710 [Candidatus Zhuqueibacterota bacterium]
MSTSLLDLLGAGFISGLIVKLLDYFYREYSLKSQEKKSARKLIDKNLDPILKASDELVGKIRSLAQADFQELIRAPRPVRKDFEKWFPYLDLMYLFAHFWARIQILRLEGLFANLGTDKRGNKLLAFFRALESAKIGLVGRAWQRGMGDSLIKQVGADYYAISFADFTKEFLSNEEFNRWFVPLLTVLFNVKDSATRQRLLVYCAIVHALIDTLDEKHIVTGEKPGWPNKLTQKSRRDLQFRTFRLYLPFVKNPGRYLSGNEPV